MIIKVKVFPKSNFNKILKINDNEYSIYVKEDTKNNKANRRMINLGDCYINGPKKLKNQLNYDDSNEKGVVRHVFSWQKMHIL